MYHTGRICYEYHICELEGISKIKTTVCDKKLMFVLHLGYQYFEEPRIKYWYAIILYLLQ